MRINIVSIVIFCLLLGSDKRLSGENFRYPLVFLEKLKRKKNLITI